MSVRHVQALLMGFTQSGKTTLITRWVTGRFPTDDTKTLPFNGVKSINITSKKHHTKEMVVVRFVDGSDVSDDDLRRLCHTADVIVACLCVELNGLDEQYIKELNNIFTTPRRPPIIVLGTMLDLRYNYQPLQLTFCQSNDEEQKTGEEIDDQTHRNSTELKSQNIATAGELTVENVTKHRVSFSVSTESSDHPVDGAVMPEEGQSDFSDRVMASITESDGNTDLDMSSISIDIQNSAFRKKNPAYWSTESINGSLVTRLDQSHDSLSEHNLEEKLLKHGDVTNVSPRAEERDFNHQWYPSKEASETETETNGASKVRNDQVSYQKPLIETHFPLNLDIPLTVKHYPKQSNPSTEPGETVFLSKKTIPYKEDDWFSEDEPDNISFREISSRLENIRSRNLSNEEYEPSVKPEQTSRRTGDLLSTSGCIDTRHVQEGVSLMSPTTSLSSTLPEDRNFHVNLDPDRVKLDDPDPKEFQALVNINNYCREWSLADGLRLAKSIKGDTYMECSACSGQNLQEVFEYIARTGSKYNKKKNEKCSVS